MKRKVLCLGDSIIFGYGVPTQEAWINILAHKASEYIFINEGMPGATTTDIKYRWLELMPYTQFELLILNGGVNDLIIGLSVEKILANLKAIVIEAAKFTNDIILLLPFKISTNPGQLAWVPAPECHRINEQIDLLNNELKELALQKDIKVVDLNFIFHDNEEHRLWFLNDGIHIKPLLHERIADLVYKILPPSEH